MVKPTRAEMRARALDELELPPDAPPEDIKSKYRSLILLHHPDKNEGSQESVEKTQRLNEAWEILSKEDDPLERMSEEEFLSRFAGLFGMMPPFIFERGGKLYAFDPFGGLGRGGPGGPRGGGDFRGADRERGGRGGRVEEEEYSDEEDDYSSDGSLKDTDHEEESYFAKLRGYIPNAIFSAMHHDKTRPRQSKVEAEEERAKILERIKEQELAQERREEERQKWKEKKEQEREQEMAEGAARRAQKNSQKKALNKVAAEEASAKANSQRQLAQKLRSDTFKAARKGDDEGVKKGVWENNVAPDGGEWLEGFGPEKEKVEVQNEDGGEKPKGEKEESIRSRRGRGKKDRRNVDKENVGVNSTPPIDATATNATERVDATLKESTTSTGATKSKRGRRKPTKPSTPLGTVDTSAPPTATESSGVNDASPAGTFSSIPVDDGSGEPKKSRRRKRQPKTPKQGFQVVEEEKVASVADSATPLEPKSTSPHGADKKVASRETGVDSASVKSTSNANGHGQAKGRISPLTPDSPSVPVEQTAKPPQTASKPKSSKFDKRPFKSKSKSTAPQFSTVPSPPHAPIQKKKPPTFDPKETLLHLAVSSSSLPLVTWLLSHGALIEERDSTSFTPLHRAIQLGEKEIVDYFLKTNSIPRVDLEEGGGGGNGGYPLPPNQTLLHLAIHAPQNKAEIIALVGPQSSKEEAEEAWEVMKEEEYWEAQEGGEEEGERMRKWEKMRWALVESRVVGWDIPEAWRRRGRRMV